MPQQCDEQELLSSFLAERDVFCPVCTYNLRNGRDDVCPECGARLDLRVGSIDLRLAPWLAAVLALAIPLGFAAVLAAVASVGAMRSAFWEASDWLILAGLWVEVVALAFGVWLLSRLRPRMLRRTRAAQWVTAVTLILVAGVFQAGVIYVLATYA